MYTRVLRWQIYHVSIHWLEHVSTERSIMSSLFPVPILGFPLTPFPYISYLSMYHNQLSYNGILSIHDQKQQYEIYMYCILLT